MDKIKEMGEGIKVQDPPVHKTTKDEFTARGKRSASAGEQCTFNISSSQVNYLWGPGFSAVAW